MARCVTTQREATMANVDPKLEAMKELQKRVGTAIREGVLPPDVQWRIILEGNPKKDLPNQARAVYDGTNASLPRIDPVPFGNLI